jgi:hypothetical protein
MPMAVTAVMPMVATSAIQATVAESAEALATLKKS